MHERKSFSRFADEFLSGKGFYIVLFACIAIIGISAWLLLFSRWSPLAGGDEEDYLDVMGDVGTTLPQQNNDAGKTGGDNRSEGKDGGETDGGATTGIVDDQPEHIVPDDSLTQELNKPGEDSAGALTVTDKPEESGGSEEQTPEDKETSVEDISFLWPVSGEIIKGYAPDKLVYSETLGDWRTHDGVDIAARQGTRVLSAANGTVTGVEDAGDGYGTVVTIDHGAGVVAVYANMAAVPTVNVGDSVTAGSVIGSVGDTASFEGSDKTHLHLSMTVNGETADPVEILPKR